MSNVKINVTPSSIIQENTQKVLDSNNAKSIKIIIIIIIVLVIIIGVSIGIKFYIDKKKKEAKLKWTDERCSNQMYMMFPGLFGPPGMSYAQNKAFCDATAMNEVSKKNNAPLQNQLNVQNKTMGQFNKHMKRMNKMMYHYKKVVTDQIVKIRKDLADTFKRLSYTYKKFKNLFTDIFLVYKSLFNTVKYFIFTILVWWKAPWGGGVLRFFTCFGEETLVYIKEDGIKKSPFFIGESIFIFTSRPSSSITNFLLIRILGQLICNISCSIFAIPVFIKERSPLNSMTPLGFSFSKRILSPFFVEKLMSPFKLINLI